MKPIIGHYYPGGSSKQIAAECVVSDNHLLTIVDRVSKILLLQTDLSDVSFSARIASTSRFLSFPDQSKFETLDNDAIDALLHRFNPSNRTKLLHYLESKIGYFIIALLVLVLVIWGFISYGLPWSSKILAFALPDAVLEEADRRSLSILDETLTGPTRLDPEVQTRVAGSFQTILDAHREYNITVLFRNSTVLGPNAFALPNGTIVFTDSIINLSENDLELVSVLAHEIGHVVNRHGMRNLVQDSLLGFFMIAVTGDISGASELFVGVPVLLTQLAYTREFERESDRYALNTLQKLGISPIHFADIMRRLDNQRKQVTGDNQKQLLGYLSTHPDIEERLTLFEN